MERLCLMALLVLVHLPVLSLAENESENSADCPPFECGKLGRIKFPFTNKSLPQCGLLTIDDCDKEFQRVQLVKGGNWYPIYHIYEDNGNIFFREEDFWKNLSSNSCVTFNSFPGPPFPSFHTKPNLILLKCDPSVHVPSFPGHDSHGCNNFSMFYAPEPQSQQNLTSQCTLIQLPTDPIPHKNTEIFDSLSADSPLEVIVSPDCKECFNDVGGGYLGSGEGKFNSPKLEKGHVYRDCNNFSISDAPEAQIPQNLQSHCSLIQLPKNKDPHPHDKEDIFDLLSADFPVEVTVSPDCKKCFYNSEQCSDSGVGKFYCSKREKGHRKLGPMIAVVGAAAAGIAVALICLCYFRRQVSYNNNVIVCWNKKSNDDKGIESFLRNHGSLMQKRYSYSEIKKMTESFRDKLGQGGYGGLFKGKLPDGRLVAVKVSKESRTNGEEFINEVASISRTSHVNIVSLLGFCAEGSKRALIYEFMFNGSLEKYIHQGPSQLDHHLGWETLYQIAIGIARGLEYLHRGCNTRILHFDIKPHNILLDEDFYPKISDFGLAKVCLQRESIISMLGPRGTAGYIAPEVFCRNFGGVSHKSDVYSYGMMVLEMVGGRRNISIEVESTSEIYFPDRIYKNLESGVELGLRQIRNEDENQLARRMIIVSLWCIQTKPSDRPKMSRVIEMLQGSIQPLLIPPRPCLSSAPRSPPRLETNASTTLGCDSVE